MTTTVEKLELVSQLGLLEGIKAGAFDVASDDVPTKAEVAALTTIATIDAIDPATTMALVNEVKAKVNEIITALKA
ncbi:hypothetical protein psageK4_063 [Pseudomonas phage psageK4]|uniref:Uncharacterized protein n=2 Tax=Otagovirus TaxID=2560197 RepID=A0AAE9BSG0_9CAUD|nr:hypothetical protein QGX14_gp172 [Pseudomonas phage psageK4]YP_010766977.1 hypothetical protein QGX15_gp175 [Pseudomonas phage psageK4e]QXV71717.1 hypothetical protein psageK4_063 [Pseudomonas phage psageK4]UAW53520.1 hypothetical protein psageK4e_072 [Pseudomonas phage psageK4e]